jgi:KaiC/GvpD/RAD55 family RecA-like ATPase
VTVPSRRCQLARGWFVLVVGWPGSGKSTLAAALAAEALDPA